MQHLEYPAIPKIIDYVETGEYCYLIMEYIKGQSLGELLRSGKRFSLREILALGKEYWNIFTVGSHRSVTGT